MEFNIAICDDNQTAINEAKTIAHSVFDELNIRHNIDEFTSPIQLLQKNKYYHFVFLDIQMETLDGISVAKKLMATNNNTSIFFMTNHTEYMDDALDEAPKRFFVKPLEKERVRKCLRKAIKQILHKQQYITVSVAGKERRINTLYIIYFYMENKRLHIITKNGEIMAENTLKFVVKQLKNIPYFSETCRGYYVNMIYVIDHTPQNIKCRYNEKSYDVCVSRRKYRLFCDNFIKWVGEEK